MKQAKKSLENSIKKINFQVPIQQLYQSQPCLRFYCNFWCLGEKLFQHVSDERHKMCSCRECKKYGAPEYTHMCNTFAKFYEAKLTIARYCCVIYDPLVSSILHSQRIKTRLAASVNMRIYKMHIFIYRKHVQNKFLDLMLIFFRLPLVSNWKF